MSIGKKIEKLRMKKNMTQKELALILGISASSVAMYELDERVPRDEIKKKISNYFDVPVQDIFF